MYHNPLYFTQYHLVQSGIKISLFSSKLPRILILYNNMKKHVHSDPRSIAAHSLHSYKITITSPSIVALANIQIQNDTPFPAQWPADKLLPEGNSTREHGSTHTHTHTQLFRSVDFLYFCTNSLLSSDFLQSSSFLVSLHLNSLSLPQSLTCQQEAPQDVECECGRNDRTMGSRLSPNPHTLRKEQERNKEVGAMEK